MAANSLPAVQVPSEQEVDRALWAAYSYILSLGRRRKERLARQAAEAAAIADGDTKTGEVCDA